MTDRERDRTLKLLNLGIKEFSKVLAQKEKALKEKNKRMKDFSSISKQLKRTSDSAKKNIFLAPLHPWRLCPLGQYFRTRHKQRSYIRKNGVQVRGSIHPSECVTNRTGKDQLYADEIREIANRHFGTLTQLPTSGILEMYSNESDFDLFIAGWAQYWNDVLKPSERLDPNLVKALIATESSFKVDANNGQKGKKRARGLMQVLDGSVRLLSYQSKPRELIDHFVNLNENDMLDPNLSICAGTRWLFRKREILVSRIGNVSWVEVILDYKSYKSLEHPQMRKFIRYYEALKYKDKSKLSISRDI